MPLAILGFALPSILRIPLIVNVTVKNLKSILWVIQSNVIKKVGVP